MATPTLPVAPGSQLFSQSVTVTDLSLVSVRYRITVSAATQAGTGPESDPVFVGTQATGQHDSVLYNAMLQCKKYTMLLYYTTVSIGILVLAMLYTVILLPSLRARSRLPVVQDRGVLCSPHPSPAGGRGLHSCRRGDIAGVLLAEKDTSYTQEGPLPV